MAYFNLWPLRLADTKLHGNLGHSWAISQSGAAPIGIGIYGENSSSCEWRRALNTALIGNGVRGKARGVEA